MALLDIVLRLSKRDKARPEAEVQADVRQFILEAPFELAEGDIDLVSLESPLGDRRRIDVEVGSTVIEVKRDLRRGRVRDEAVEQLAGYVKSRADESGRRYVGVLTDGVEWTCYDRQGDTLREVSTLQVGADAEGVRKLVFWLEGVLATASGITPNAREIEGRLGAASTAYALDRATIAALYRENADLPTVKVKRGLWSRLLTSALGSQFDDSDDLFIEHTLLVNTAEIIAHAVLGLPVIELNPASLLSGDKFAESGVYGVVEADFFDWVIEVPGGEQFVKTLARRLNRFDWSAVKEDVLKVLYESIIGAETRKELGEYYTPDWLAEAVVREVVSDPLSTRVLDPACGSGTFLFQAIRLYLEAADRAEMGTADALDNLTQHVFGMDLHPVAVTFARVTYLLAIGRTRLTDATRRSVHIPVFLGDSLQWREQNADLWSAGELVIQADDGRELFGSQLRFPDALLADAKRFDELVEEMAARAATSKPGRPPPSLSTVFLRLAIPAQDQPVVEATFSTMCRLHNEGRDHIWGYYIRNMARPVWLAREANRVDVVVGNPPWLAYRHMPQDMQLTFKKMSEQRNIWAGKEVATQQDISALFAVRATELYLRQGGRLAVVMPNAAVDRGQYIGFRAGNYSEPIGSVSLAFEKSWDLRRVRPHFFPRGASVVFASRTRDPVELSAETEIWSGRLSRPHGSWREAEADLTREPGSVQRSEGLAKSPFAPRFAQGATFNPRFLFLVNEKPAGPLGIPFGRIAVTSSRSVNEKKPYKFLSSVEGVVESEFVRPVYTGENLFPFRVGSPLQAVIPCSSSDLLARKNMDLYPGLKSWWDQAEELWEAHRSSDRLSLLDQLDYQSKLTRQLPVPEFRVVYNASGMHLVAAKIRSDRAIISKSLYWASFRDEAEADYLCAILNCGVTTEFLRPFMSYGKDERHVDKHLWQLPIPAFAPTDASHLELARLGHEASAIAAGLELNEELHFSAIRRQIRQTIDSSPAGMRIAELVFEMLS